MKRTLPAFALVAALAASPAFGAAPGTGEHVVRPGETLEAITAKYLGSPQLWREVWKLNPQIKNPNMLAPGQRIRVLLPDSLPASSALVSRVSRRVQRKPEPEPWQPAQPGDRLYQRHGVQTLEQSSAELKFEDESLLTLAERSLVFLRGMQRPALPRDRNEIEIVEGQGDLERRPGRVRQEQIEITVGTAVATPSAANARARFRSVQKSAKVMSYAGALSVGGGGKSVKVAEGMGVSVPEGGAPSAPEKLLEAPALQAVATDHPQPLMRWPAVRKASGYTVEVCRDRRCAEVVARQTGVTATEWTAPSALPAGEMFWRVTAESASGLDGYPAVAALHVRRSLSGAVRVDGRPVRGVAVALYRDGSAVARTTTSENGGYAFREPEPGQYAIAVDSRTIGAAGTWAEQLTGPAGAVCGGVRRETPGDCGGGKSPDAADDASGLDSAEHVAMVTMAEAPVSGIDFGFSFNAVTNTADAGQGSLRQFVENANAIPGPNAMKFAAAAVEGERVIRLGAPLPPLRDAGTTIDGRPLQGEPSAAAGAMHVGSVIRVGAAEKPLLNPPRPQLVLDFGGAEVGLDAESGLVVRNVALRGAKTQLRARGDVRVEDAVVGALLTRADGATGIEIAGQATLLRTLVTGMSDAAVLLRAGGALAAEHLEVSDSGFGPQSAGAVVLESGRARILHSLLLLNTGAPALRAAAVPDAIEETTFRSNRVAVAVPASTIAQLRSSRFEDNIVSAIAAPARPPAVDGITMDEQGMTVVSGSAGGPGRVDLYTSDLDGRLTPAGSAEAAPDGAWSATLPPRTPPRIGV